eukprot:3845661-Prymnesium_polylepis.1
MLKRAPPAVRALNPRVRAVWPFAWLWADAAGGHTIGKTHSRHVLLQGQLIRLKRKLQRVIVIRASSPDGWKLAPPRRAAASGNPTSSRPTPAASFGRR